jgi:hypothetical protein
MLVAAGALEESDPGHRFSVVGGGMLESFDCRLEREEQES